MKLFKILEKECNKKKINRSEEYKFYNANKYELSKNNGAFRFRAS